MATIPYTANPVKSFGPITTTITWTSLTTTNNYGAAIELAGFADRSVELTGVLGVDGEVTMYGSNKPAPNEATDADWFILTDGNGNPIVLTAVPSGKQIFEFTRWIRPKVTDGDGDTILVVSMTAVQKK